MPIELVSGLPTECSKLTLKRFIARRGIPEVIYSDNAMNFLGSTNRLKEFHDFFECELILIQFKSFCQKMKQSGNLFFHGRLIGEWL